MTTRRHTTHTIKAAALSGLLSALLPATLAAAQPPADAEPVQAEPTQAEPAAEPSQAEPEPTPDEPSQAEPIQPALPITSLVPEAPPPEAAARAEGEEQEAEPEVRFAFEPGDGFTLGTPDRRFELNIRARAMLLFTADLPAAEMNDDGTMGPRPDPALDLTVRRARLSLSGRMFDPNIRYRMQLAFAPGDLQVDAHGVPHRTPLLDWYLDFTFLRDLSVRVGQYVLQYNRSRVVSSSSMQLVDRSLANAEFNLDRDLSLDVRSLDFLGLGLFRYYVGISANEGRDSLLGGDTGFLYLARFEVMPMGTFSDYSEGDLARSAAPHLAIGAAYAFGHGSHFDRGILGHAAADGGTFDYHNAEIDLAFVYQGFSFYSELMFRDGTHTSGGLLDDMGNAIPMAAVRRGMGTYWQLGYLIANTDLEVAGRYGFVRPVGAESGIHEQSELGMGVTYFFHRHAFKLQADLFHIWDDADFSSAQLFDAGETRIRVMLQASL